MKLHKFGMTVLSLSTASIAQTVPFNNTIYASSMNGTGPNTQRTFQVAYVSSVVSTRDEFKKHPRACRWWYTDYALDRTLSYADTQGKQKVVDTRHWGGVPKGHDQTGTNCNNVYSGSIIPETTSMNSMPAWQGQIDSDKPTLDELVNNPLP